MAMKISLSAISVAVGYKNCRNFGCIKLLGSLATPQLLYLRLETAWEA
jgi:hypothetical protein